MRAVAFTVLLGLASVAPSVLAQEDASGQAKKAFERGKALFGAERYAEAAAMFNEAYRLKPTWKLFYNIGQSEAAAKRYGLALEAFERYLVEGGDEVQDERGQEVRREIERLKTMVGSLEIQAPEGAQVFVDNIGRGEAPLPGAIKVAAGIEHFVQVRLGHEEILSQTVKVGSGDTVALDASGTDDEPTLALSGDAPRPEPKTVHRGKHSGLWTWGWVTAGVGAAVVAAGAVTGGVMLSLDKELKSSCPGGECGPEFHDDLDRRDNLGVAADAMFVTGGLALTTGIVLIIVSGNRGEEETPAVGLAPMGGPGVSGAAIQGRF